MCAPASVQTVCNELATPKTPKITIILCLYIAMLVSTPIDDTVRKTNVYFQRN